MKKNTTFWAAPIVAAGLALTLFAPAGAQTTEPMKGGDSQKPVTNTYDKKPDPSGKNQDFKARTYDKKPDPKGEGQSLDAATYNKAPDPQGDDQKLDSRTYTEKPPAQYERPPVDEDDVSNLESDVVPTYEDRPDPDGKRAPATATTYNKTPDPTGMNQKLEAVRYQEENSANNGKESKLEMQVLEGSVKE